MIAGSRTGRTMLLPRGSGVFVMRRAEEIGGLALIACSGAVLIAYASYFPDDPSPLTGAAGPTRNLLGGFGAALTDIGVKTLGFVHLLLIAIVCAWGWRLFSHRPLNRIALRLTILPLVLIAASVAAGAASSGAGGSIGTMALRRFAGLGPLAGGLSTGTIGLGAGALATAALVWLAGYSPSEWRAIGRGTTRALHRTGAAARRQVVRPATADNEPYHRDGGRLRAPPIERPAPPLHAPPLAETDAKATVKRGLFGFTLSDAVPAAASSPRETGTARTAHIQTGIQPERQRAASLPRDRMCGLLRARMRCRHRRC